MILLLFLICRIRNLFHWSQIWVRTFCFFLNDNFVTQNKYQLFDIHCSPSHKSNENGFIIIEYYSVEEVSVNRTKNRKLKIWLMRNMDGCKVLFEEITHTNTVCNWRLIFVDTLFFEYFRWLYQDSLSNIK